MTSHICQCLSILVTYRFPKLFICPRYVPRAIGRRNVASLNTGGFMFPTFYGMMQINGGDSLVFMGGKICAVTLESIRDFFGTGLSLQFCTQEF